ncbi:MAG: NADH-ubiquinone/plastoquinone oxidoreductase chain 6 [Myxococcales bacterium]|nr:NADH-ubiquinone/plastoquinone oxidoreductase chain 6 [Myxococcales bacterium]
MKVLLLILTMLLTLGAIDAIAPQLAVADPIPAQAVNKGRTTTKVVKRSPHSDKIESNGKGMALLFWAFAAATIGGALFVVTRRNLIAAVMGMVGCFLGISAVYMMLYASFLAVIQMLVYAGAIMVLFVFVVMILNRPEDEPVAPTGRAGKALGGLAIVYLVGRLIFMLMKVQPPNPLTAINAPAAVELPGDTVGTIERVDWGSVKAVGWDLFGPGLFVFEAISLLLLIAVVGAIAIARPLHEDQDNQSEPFHPPRDEAAEAAAAAAAAASSGGHA